MVTALGLVYEVALGINVQDRSPHTSFILKGSQILALLLKSWFKFKTSIQEYKNEIQNSYQTRAWTIWYMFPVQCEVLRINHLTPSLVVRMPYACWVLRRRANYMKDFKWRLHFQFGVAFWRVVLSEEYILKGQIEHCSGCWNCNTGWKRFLQSFLYVVGPTYKLEIWRKEIERVSKTRRRWSKTCPSDSMTSLYVYANTVGHINYNRRSQH
jgi:hypothetical protein